MKKRHGFLHSVNNEDLKLLEKKPRKFWRGVTQIGVEAFAGLTSLTSIDIPNTITSIDDLAFQNCRKLRSITISNSVKEIGILAFSYCGLKSVTIPEGVTSIGESAFYGCESLTSVILPKGLRAIYKLAFAECSSLTSITIPESVKSIGRHAFAGCEGLTSITFSDGLASIGNGAFIGCRNLKSVTIPNTVNSIGEQAFLNCKSLNSITIPASVYTIGKEAFSGCSQLTSVTILDGVTSIGGGAFSDTHLTSIAIPESVTSIGKRVFNISSLKRIEYGDLTFEDKDFNWVVEYKGKLLKFNSHPNMLDFGSIITFVKDAQRRNINLPFVPHQSVVENLKSDDITLFFGNSKAYNSLLEEFAKENGKARQSLILLKREAREDFFKLCYVSGLFSKNSKERLAAEKFIREEIIPNYSEDNLHERFSGLNTKQNGFNPKFAEFLIENFDEDFLIAKLNDLEYGDNGIDYFSAAYNGFEDDTINYFSEAYNTFNEILKSFPNAEIRTNTDRDRLTEKDVISFLKNTKYDNVRYGNLAEVVGRYGYSQEQFETLQSWFEKGIQKGSNLSAFPDNSEGKIKFELLKKDNPLGAVLGNITNCCQRIGDAGESCVEHGMSNPNGGFVVFKYENRIIGQAWVWYNKSMGKLCFDNIEIPNSAKGLVKKNGKEFKDCLTRAAKSISESMTKAGHKVSLVTMGKGYNDLLESISEGEFNKIKNNLHGGAPEGSYTDIKAGELLIPFAQAAISSGVSAEKKVLNQQPDLEI